MSIGQADLGKPSIDNPFSSDSGIYIKLTVKATRVGILLKTVGAYETVVLQSFLLCHILCISSSEKVNSVPIFMP